MDHPWVVAVAFGCGWLLREWSFPSKGEDSTVCRCQCSCPVAVTSDQPFAGSTVWGLVLVVIVVIVIFGNTALALRFSYQDAATGQDKTVSVAVKGKSKGVYGGSKGLTLTN